MICHTSLLVVWPKKSSSFPEFVLRTYEPTREITEILEAIQSLKPTGYTLFDGCLRHNKVPGVKGKIMIWDVFVWNADFMASKPFRRRRNILESLFVPEEDPG